MANVRMVTVASSAANRAKRFETSAATWGELQGEISRAGLSLTNVEAIMSPGNVTLSRNEAELYLDGDFKVFLVPTKNKAGITQAEAEKMAKDITKAIMTAAERSSVEKVKELKTEIIEQIEQFYDVDLDNPTEEDDNWGPGMSKLDEQEELREANRYR